MKHAKIILGFLCLALLIWGIVSWPLPRFATSAIPTSAQNLEHEAPRRMMPGDHLQFLYHMWLAKDTFAGNTRAFFNPYEFNTGDESLRHFPEMRYYLPFTLVFSIFSPAGHAAAWNATGFVSIWLTLLFTWLLARRLTSSRPAALVAASVSILFPYRWITLLAGSPTGLAMMWVPLVFLGLDILIRDHKRRGSILAGGAIFLAGWCDPHVVFYTGIAAPFWCLLSWLVHREKLWPTRAELRSLVRAALPLLIFMALVLGQARGTKKSLEDTRLSKREHPIQTVANNSPHLRSAFISSEDGVESQLYLGIVLILLLAGSTAGAWLRRGEPGHRTGLCVTLLCLAIASATVLALGINAPGGARSWRLLTRILPPYGMIRQPAKIFILLPALASVVLALGLSPLLKLCRLDKHATAVCLVLGAALLVESQAQVRPLLCLLDKQQGAYEAIAEHAARQGHNPHLLALPLWPGDSHWTSLNQHYVSLYRIRMINGYRPTRRATYFEEVYSRFESMNKGGITDAQLDNLLGRGIEYLVLHENAFPEKVSPFPVGHVLQAMLAHPRIKLLAQDGAAWSFRIVNDNSGVSDIIPPLSHHFPARLWQGERSDAINVTIFPDQDASGGRFAQLSSPDGRLATHPYPIVGMTNQCYLVRMRATQPSSAVILREGDEIQSSLLAATPDAWTWQTVPLPSFPGYETLQLGMQATNGPVDIDLTLLTTTAWNPHAMTNALRLPAFEFFHGGHTDIRSLDVVLLPDRDPESVVFYGPKLPVPAGAYKIELAFTSKAKPGTRLGHLRSRYPHGTMDVTPVIAGEPAVATYSQPNNLRMSVDFHYSRKGPIRIRSLTITPVGEARKGPPSPRLRRTSRRASETANGSTGE